LAVSNFLTQFQSNQLTCSISSK